MMETNSNQSISGGSQQSSEKPEILVNTTSVTENSKVNTAVRYFYMDNLRAIAMLGGIVFHAMLAYSLYLHEGWPTADTSSSTIIDFVSWLMHMFRMPVFFLISGFFACYLIRKRGNVGYLKNRMMRITLPFVVFWPLVSFAVIGSLVYAASSTTISTPVIDLIRNSMVNPDPTQESPPLTTMHLWFLYYLFFFCLATVCLSYIIRLPESIKNVLTHPATLVIALPLLTCVAFFKLHMPHAAPESFKLTWWPFLYYGSFFFVGWLFYQKQNMLERLTPWIAPMIVISILAYGVFYYLHPKEATFEQLMIQGANLPALNTKQIILSFCTSVLSWHLTLLSLIGAKKFLNNHSPKVRYIADSSYWLYILHIPLLFALQLFFHTLEWPLVIELGLTIGITFGVGLLTYAVLIRNTPIGWMLNGKPDKTSEEPKTADNTKATATPTQA